jgi:uncharacterized protein involved in cysteine biosynthesis
MLTITAKFLIISLIILLYIIIGIMWYALKDLYNQVDKLTKDTSYEASKFPPTVRMKEPKS